MSTYFSKGENTWHENTQAYITFRKGTNWDDLVAPN